jgi:hypothetical protein
LTVQVAPNSPGGNCRHTLVGVVFSLATLEFQGEGDRGVPLATPSWLIWRVSPARTRAADVSGNDELAPRHVLNYYSQGLEPIDSAAVLDAIS